MMLFSVCVSALFLAAYAALTTAPATVYEAAEMSPQNMDYDSAKKLFPAHAGWFNDKLIHYYKFRMYTPDTYPNTIKAPGANIPVGDVFLLTTTADETGLVANQKPIIRYHHVDGELYSDFVRVTWATVGAGYVANTHKSFDDLVAASAVLTKTDLFVNLPVVPTGSRLQNPAVKTDVAPILPTVVWYNGTEVQTFVWEVTSAKLQSLWSSTRTTTSPDFEITVVPKMVATVAGKPVVLAAPLWHLNQHWRAVDPDINGGGPMPLGQRNVINTDRGDAGYSPLWAILWVTALPLGYAPDQVSNGAAITPDNSFKIADTPMIVNCPNVGAVGSANPNKRTNFVAAPVEATDTVVLQAALIMASNVTVKAMAGAKLLSTTTTNMMGGIVLEFSAAELTAGDNSVKIVDSDGKELFTYTVMRVLIASSTTTSTGELPTTTPTTTTVTASASSLATTPVAPALFLMFATTIRSW
jgi:hypothetical protein